MFLGKGMWAPLDWSGNLDVLNEWKNARQCVSNKVVQLEVNMALLNDSSTCQESEARISAPLYNCIACEEGLCEVTAVLTVVAVSGKNLWEYRCV